jgi:galactokinase
LNAVTSIQQRAWAALGELLYASHRGLRDEYEVSCRELDFLVDAVAGSAHVYGARMMGGGFGGCTINLAAQPPDEDFKKQLIDRYKAQFGWECAFIDVVPSASATAEIVSAPI